MTEKEPTTIGSLFDFKDPIAHVFDSEPGLHMLHEFAIEWATTKFNSSADELPPTWMLVRNGILNGFAAHYHDDRSKDMVAYAIKVLLKKAKVSAYSYVSEAWAMNVPDEEIEDFKTGKRKASKEPNRKEVLVVSSYTPQESVTTYFNIQRAGWRITLSDRENVNSTQDEGRFANLFRQIESLPK